MVKGLAILLTITESSIEYDEFMCINLEKKDQFFFFVNYRGIGKKITCKKSSGLEGKQKA